MIKGRRVGTFTAGIVLVVFGTLFLIHTVMPKLSFNFIFSLWPVILILLGIEIVISYIVNKDEKLRYDGGAIALIIILALFSMCMGGMEFVIENAQKFNWVIK
jgi:uncharacterized membrane protein HdeD (DUF308 family)